MVTKRDREREKGESSMAAEKGKMWEEGPLDVGRIDELLEVLGYQVRSSDMADVHRKLEQLEMAMEKNMEAGISLLSADIVHYNPSSISGWVKNILSELNNASTPTNFNVFPNQSTAAIESSTTMIGFSSVCGSSLAAESSRTT